MVGMGIFALNQLSQVNESTLVVGNNTVPSIIAIDQIDATTGLYRQNQLQHVISTSSIEMGNLEAEMASIEANMDKDFEQYKLLISDNEDESKMNLCKAAWQKYLVQSKPFIELSRKLKNEDAVTILNSQAKDTFDQLQENIDGWRVLDIQTSNDTLKNVQTVYDTARNLIIGVIVVAAIVALSFGIYLARSIARPVQAIAQSANRLAEGDVAQEVTVTSQDEIGDMANAFRQMIAYQQRMAESAMQLAKGNLTISITPKSDKDVFGQAFAQMTINFRDIIQRVQQSADQLASASKQLSAAAEQVAEAGQQVTSTIQQVANGSNQQTRSISEATNNTEQIARAAEGVARGSQEQAQAIQKTSVLVNDTANIINQVGQIANLVTTANTKVTQVARNGVTSVEQTNQGMTNIRSRAVATTQKVKEMNIRAKEIGRIVETIDNIADKTDMLALNAAVEAARAGEHGRGFAVVADQVRKLSEDSKVATREIGELIERVQDTVSEAIASMDSTTIEVDNGTRLTKDTTHALQEILQAAEEAAKLAQQIGDATKQLGQKSEGVVASIESVSAVVEENTAAAEQMAANSQEVTATMEGIASVVEENTASTEEVSASAEEMLAQVEEVTSSAKELANLAEQLRAVVAKFQVGS